MKILEALLYMSTFIVALTLQMVCFLKDNAAPDHTKQDLLYKRIWHGAGGIIHIWAGVVMAKIFGIPWGLLTLACTWYLFDGAINTWYLKKEWFNIGTTAAIDIAQRKMAGWVGIDPRTISAILKHILLAAAITSFFFY